MLRVTLAALRTRAVTLLGTFVALALGVGLLATTGLALASTLDAPPQRPERFAGAPVVVRAFDEVRIGDRTEPLAHPHGVPPELAARFPAAIIDRSFPVRADNRDLVGHPWPVATYGGYRLVAGRVPARADEVVLSGSAPGSTITVTTAAGTDVRTVVGVVGPVPYEQAVFFHPAEAARLSPRIDNLVLQSTPDVTGVRVLTGDNRRLADPDPDRDTEALVAVNALLGTAGGVTAFVSVFVVASTFAFAVAQRRRELGLLRTAGATPGQVRRMLLGEAAVVGVVASAAGCLLGSRAAPVLARFLVEERLAPDWFTVGGHTWPYQVAFWTGLLVALTGAAAATVRAGRVRPVEALREAAVDSRALTPGRLLVGAALLATALGLLAWRIATDPGEALHRKTYITQPMLLITAVALLTPLLVRPLLRVVRLPGVIGLLVRENAAAGVRRTAAIAAPVLITVALAGSLLGATATITEAKATELRDRTTADLVISAEGGLDARTVAKVRAVPGTTVLTSAPTEVFLPGGSSSEARAVDPATLAALRILPVEAGRLADLDDGSIVVNEEWERHTVGERVDLWLGDGTRTTLRIAAVLATGTGSTGAYVTPHNAPGAVPDLLEVRGQPDAVRAAVPEVLTRDQWLAGEQPRTGRQTRAGLLVVLGIALVYTAIALANTLVMATSDRAREVGALRFAGATRRQVLLLIAAEALTVTAVGALLGLAVTAVDLLGIRAALALLSVRSPIVVPWEAIGAVTAACAVVAVTAALIPAVVARHRQGMLGR